MERIWPEVNSRVNYPLKRILIRMEENQQIDMTDATTKFAVSFVLCNVASCGLSSFVSAWNHHSIPGMLTIRTNSLHTSIYAQCGHDSVLYALLAGRGVPIHLEQQCNDIITVPIHVVPSTVCCPYVSVTRRNTH